MPVPGQENERSCICVLRASNYFASFYEFFFFFFWSCSDSGIFSLFFFVLLQSISDNAISICFADLFNTDLMTEYGLNLTESGFSTDYDSSVDAGIGVGFATAAYRFGHSQVSFTN